MLVFTWYGAHPNVEAEWTALAALLTHPSGWEWMAACVALESDSFSVWLGEQPDHPVALPASWSTPTVLQLARAFGDPDPTAAFRQKAAVTVRDYAVVPAQTAHFEALWAESAAAELNRAGVHGKWLYRVRSTAASNTPDDSYVSVSAWDSLKAAEATGPVHAEWQKTHEPYPLLKPIVRRTLEVKAFVAND